MLCEVWVVFCCKNKEYFLEKEQNEETKIRVSKKNRTNSKKKIALTTQDFML